MWLPAASRRNTVIAVAIASLGIALVLVALLAGSDGSVDDDAQRSGRSAPRSVDPLPAVDPSSRPSTDAGKSGKRTNPPKVDPSAPFANSHGAAVPHKVTIRVTSNGASAVGIRYRDGKKTQKEVVSKRFATTRTVNGPSPIAFVGIQVGPDATRASCEIRIDGETAITRTAKGPFSVAVCAS